MLVVVSRVHVSTDNELMTAETVCGETRLLANLTTHSVIAALQTYMASPFLWLMKNTIESLKQL
jgi:hypothetical protein